MRVLILTQYYAPEPVDKVVDLARGLCALGHNVQVITGFPCYPYGRTYDGYRQSLYREETVDGALVTRIPQIPDHSKSVWKRALYYVSFAISAMTIGLWRAKRADVILVYQSALPIGLAAWVLSCAKRIPFVLDVVDLWPESVAASGMMKNGLALRMIRRVASFIYRRANRIHVITEGYRETLIRMGVPPEKIEVIYHWPPDGKFDRVAPDREFAASEGLAGRFNILFAGTMGPCQHLETVVEAAQRLRDVPEVQFVLAGDGVEYTRLVHLAETLKLDNVRFLGRRSPEDVAKMYALADLLLVHLKSDPMSRVSIPSKTFAYMASGRPLLMAVEGEAGRLVQKHRCGVSIPPSDPEAMSAAIRGVAQTPTEQRGEMGDAALMAYREHYSSRIQIKKVLRRLNDVAFGKAA
jgi:glycosyltransferase involved in cell wall biosynthesis